MQHTPLCKASTHQGDPNIFHPQSVGRQCLPNSLISCVMATINHPLNWTMETMDYKLQEGDKLYTTINVGHELLLPSDLPTCVHINNRVCEIVRGIEAFGSFVENITETKKLLFTLCTLIQKTATSALLCMGDKTGSSALALLSMDTSFFIFDAHSRDHCGMPCPMEPLCSCSSIRLMKLFHIFVNWLIHYQQCYSTGHFGMCYWIMNVIAPLILCQQVLLQ